jgi:hypothetical protein
VQPPPPRPLPLAQQQHQQHQHQQQHGIMADAGEAIAGTVHALSHAAHELSKVLLAIGGSASASPPPRPRAAPIHHQRGDEEEHQQHGTNGHGVESAEASGRVAKQAQLPASAADAATAEARAHGVSGNAELDA